MNDTFEDFWRTVVDVLAGKAWSMIAIKTVCEGAWKKSQLTERARIMDAIKEVVEYNP